MHDVPVCCLLFIAGVYYLQYSQHEMPKSHENADDHGDKVCNENVVASVGEVSPQVRGAELRNQNLIRIVIIIIMESGRVAKTCRPCQPVGANFSWLVLIFG